jgi:hypothetical protein
MRFAAASTSAMSIILRLPCLRLHRREYQTFSIPDARIFACERRNAGAARIYRDVAVAMLKA